MYEANAYPGGKLSQFTESGYRFDAGPSLFTMPHYVDELFEVAGENPREHFQYRRLEVVCNYFWEDGTRLKAYADPSAFSQEVEAVLGVPAERLLHILQRSTEKYELTGRIFLEKSLHRAKTWFSPAVVRALLHLPRYDLFSSMHTVNERLAGHPKLVQLFNRFATYNGSNPYRAPGLLTVIPHFEHGIGAFFPEGGMHSITQAVYQLAERLGVRFHFESPVDRILVEKKQAIGVQADGKKEIADLVVSNMDVFFAYQKLLADQPRPKRILEQEKSTSAIIFYWGIKKEFPELDLHNIFFSEDYREEFECLSEGRITDDPTVYINISSKLSPGDAPEGAEAWFVMVNAPFQDGQDWEGLVDRTRMNVLQKLSRILGRDIVPLIEQEGLLDPRSIESRTRSHLGALYGTSSNNRMAAFLRHPNFSRKIRNLYFCGGSVHPGGGIPLALLSAKIVAGEVVN